jgi:uncharacterized membrane protein
MGAREIVNGIGLLSKTRPAGWLWARVAGDALDMALLAGAYSSPSAERERVSGAIAAIAGVTALDVICSRRYSRDGQAGAADRSGLIRVTKVISVNRSPEDLYAFWRHVENLPRFMNHLETVRITGDNRSHWVAKAPAGKSVEWDAEIVKDIPNEVIAWRSLEGADIFNTGEVRFEKGPEGHGTTVRVDLEYSPPGGFVSSIMAKIFGEEPEQQVREDLRRFKQFMETGETPTTEGQSSGPRSLVAKMAHSLNPGKEKR